jgi:hypothetical protein
VPARHKTKLPRVTQTQIPRPPEPLATGERAYAQQLADEEARQRRGEDERRRAETEAVAAVAVSVAAAEPATPSSEPAPPAAPAPQRPQRRSVMQASAGPTATAAANGANGGGGTDLRLPLAGGVALLIIALLAWWLWPGSGQEDAQTVVAAAQVADAGQEQPIAAKPPEAIAAVTDNDPDADIAATPENADPADTEQDAGTLSAEELEAQRRPKKSARRPRPSAGAGSRNRSVNGARLPQHRHQHPIWHR